jgi:hypothetical protein
MVVLCRVHRFSAGGNSETIQKPETWFWETVAGTASAPNFVCHFKGSIH